MDNVKEMLTNHISEDVLTEEVTNELSTVIEALVMEKAEEKFEVARENLIKEYDQKLEMAIEEQMKEEQEKINDYMSYAAEEFVSENKVKIENAIVVEKATRIIDGIQGVFEQNGISLADCEQDIVKESINKYENTAEQLNTVTEELIETRKKCEDIQKALVFEQKTKYLTAIESERVLNLMDGLVTESVQDFSKKIEGVIKMVKTTSNKSVTENIEDVVDEVIYQDVNNDSDVMKRYLTKKK